MKNKENSDMRGGIKTLYATSGAFVRDGKYADIHQVPDNFKLELKKAEEGFRRDVLLKFDLSGLCAEDVAHAYFNPKFSTSPYNTDFKTVIPDGTVFYYDIYTVDPDLWDEKSVTFNSVPAGRLILENVPFYWNSEFDLADAVRSALYEGKTTFSIRFVAVTPTVGQQKMWFGSGDQPYLLISGGASDKNYVYELLGDSEKNKALWTRAEQIVDEWYTRYLAIKDEVSEVVPLRSVEDRSAYGKKGFYGRQCNLYENGERLAYEARTVDGFQDLDTYIGEEWKNAARDEFGGIMVESFKQEATGFFHTKKLDGRWWIIDPLGYPFIAAGISDVHYSQKGSPLQKEVALAMHGSYDAWAKDAIKLVKKLKFTNIARPVAEVYNNGDDTVFLMQKYGASISGLMNDYGKAQNMMSKGDGSSVFSTNNTMPVFDPSFEEYADEWCRGYEEYKGVKNIIGFMTDNELPMDVEMLDCSLGVNYSDTRAHNTYVCAWTWFKRITGKDNPSNSDITNEIRDLFRGFVYDRYFSVVKKAFRKYDTEHMYMGCRFVTKARDAKWMLRFASLYMDCMTINWYGAEWEPNVEKLYNVERYGDMPFIVTEFYAKAGDAYLTKGKKLANNHGAGIYVETQAERGLFYQTYVLRMLESRNCVGWEWFQYMDNDPTLDTPDASSIDGNKGIVSSELVEYPALNDAMTQVNGKIYEFANYFVNKNK